MSTRTSNKSRPIKRKRRSNADILSIQDAMYDLLLAENPMTVRQVFYRMVSEGVIDKTENAYKNTVVRQLGLMRRAGRIPFSWIADSTRWQRKPDTHSSLQSMLQYSADMYRHSVWNNQDAYVEVWLEKEALAGVLYNVTAEWDVPLMVTRGYPSISYLHVAAEQMTFEERPCYLYYFGDHDPSGVDISRKTEADLREFATDVDLHFERMAVTLDQIEEFDLITRPTKKTDSRSKNFKGESVEVDAIPPATLKDIVRGCIQQHIDIDALKRMYAVEEAERETLNTIVANLEGAA